MSVFRPVALITGASAGIGSALAYVFARNGHELALVGRREAQLVALADEIAAMRRPRPATIPLDLTRADAAARLAHELTARGLEPAIVVNNAGFGLLGPASELDRSEQLVMIELNVRTLTDLSLRWIDRIERHKGGILNVASVAGFLPSPGMAVYHATKAYVLSFTEALHFELAPRGIHVTALCPGPVPTEFQARAGVRVDSFSRLFVRSPEWVARDGYDGFVRGRRVVVPGFANKIVAFLPRILPRGVVLRLADARQRGRRKPATAQRWPRRPGAES